MAHKMTLLLKARQTVGTFERSVIRMLHSHVLGKSILEGEGRGTNGANIIPLLQVDAAFMFVKITALCKSIR